MESVFISKIQHKHPTENPSIFHRELGNYVFLSPDRALSYDNHQLRIVGGIDLFEAMLQQIQLACQDVDKLSIGDTITCQGRSVIPEARYGGIWWDSSTALGDPFPSIPIPSFPIPSALIPRDGSRRWSWARYCGTSSIVPRYSPSYLAASASASAWEDGHDGQICPPGTWKKTKWGMVYPLVNCHIAMERSTICNG